MNRAEACTSPPDDELLPRGEGEQSDPAIEDHVSGCAACQARRARLDGQSEH